jgi:hypothetical protein
LNANSSSFAADSMKSVTSPGFNKRFRLVQICNIGSEFGPSSPGRLVAHDCPNTFPVPQQRACRSTAGITRNSKYCVTHERIIALAQDTNNARFRISGI